MNQEVIIDFLQKFGSEISIAALIIAALTFLAKLFFTKSAEAAVMKYGSELQVELESHKSELELLKVKYQIQFSSLNEKRGEFIAQLFSEMYDLEKALQDFTSVIRKSDWTVFDEKDKKVYLIFESVRNLFEKNRIYLDEQLCDTIDNNFVFILDVIIEMSKAKKMGDALGKVTITADFPEGKTPVEIWSIQDQKARKDIVENRKKLAKQFRFLLGVNLSSIQTQNNE